jgi:hypothetical protein
MHRSLSFAMQRVCFRTKRSFPAMNGVAEIALDYFDSQIVGCR